MANTVSSQFELACEFLAAYLRLKAPIDTGNLTQFGVGVVYKRPDLIQVVIGNELADYAIYTNEPWLSPRWRGRKNPNEGWIQRALAEALPTMKSILTRNTRVSLREIDELKSQIQNKILINVPKGNL